jgi:hypothetical protein
MDEKLAEARADMMQKVAVDAKATAHSLDLAGWHVSAQQLRTVSTLLHDVERRLRNGDDLRG